MTEDSFGGRFVCGGLALTEPPALAVDLYWRTNFGRLGLGP